MSQQNPPLAHDLSGAPIALSWKFVESRVADPAPVSPVADARAAGEEDLQAQVRRLTAALEDIVTLALSSADYKERAIMMHRRAVAALSAIRGRERRDGPER